nr:hypothetical protein [Tanacetum cinerariifolium]
MHDDREEEGWTATYSCLAVRHSVDYSSSDHFSSDYSSRDSSLSLSSETSSDPSSDVLPDSSSHHSLRAPSSGPKAKKRTNRVRKSR